MRLKKNFFKETNIFFQINYLKRKGFTNEIILRKLKNCLPNNRVPNLQVKN